MRCMPAGHEVPAGLYRRLDRVRRHTPSITYHCHILEHSSRFCSKLSHSVLLGRRGGIRGRGRTAAATATATATSATLCGIAAGRLVRIDVGDIRQSSQHDAAACGAGFLLGHPVADTCLAAVVPAWKHAQLAHLRLYAAVRCGSPRAAGARRQGYVCIHGGRCGSRVE